VEFALQFPTPEGITPPAPEPEPEPTPPESGDGSNVVTLDAFRKK
jgi:hypothetical protein